MKPSRRCHFLSLSILLLFLLSSCAAIAVLADDRTTPGFVKLPPNLGEDDDSYERLRQALIDLGYLSQKHSNLRSLLSHLDVNNDGLMDIAVTYYGEGNTPTFDGLFVKQPNGLYKVVTLREADVQQRSNSGIMGWVDYYAVQLPDGTFGLVQLEVTDSASNLAGTLRVFRYDEQSPTLQMVLSDDGLGFGLPRDWGIRHYSSFPVSSKDKIIVEQSVRVKSPLNVFKGFSTSDPSLNDMSMADIRELTYYGTVTVYAWDDGSRTYRRSYRHNANDIAVLNEFLHSLKSRDYQKASTLFWSVDYVDLNQVLETNAPDLILDILAGQRVFVDLLESERYQRYSKLIVATESALDKPYAIELMKHGFEWFVVDIYPLE